MYAQVFLIYMVCSTRRPAPCRLFAVATPVGGGRHIAHSQSHLARLTQDSRDYSCIVAPRPSPHLTSQTQSLTAHAYDAYAYAYSPLAAQRRIRWPASVHVHVHVHVACACACCMCMLLCTPTSRRRWRRQRGRLDQPISATARRSTWQAIEYAAGHRAELRAIELRAIELRVAP